MPVPFVYALPLRQLITTIICLILPLGCIAATNQDGNIVVTFKNGEEMFLPLVDADNDPVAIEFKPDREWDYDRNTMVPTGKIIVYFGGYSYMFDDVAKYRLIAPASGIVTPEMAPNGSAAPVIYFTNSNTLIIKGLKPFEKTVLATVDGKYTQEIKADGYGDLTIMLEQLNPGYYVAGGAGFSFKFLKK